MNIREFNKHFHLSETQITKFEEWQKSLSKAYFGEDNNGISITFHYNKLGQVVTAKRMENEYIDLTEWENF